MSKTSTLIYGSTGNGKTGQVGSFALAINRLTGKRTRIYTAEGGNMDTIGHIEAAGLIDIIDISQRPNHFETIDYAVRGFTFDGAGKPLAPSAATWEEFGGFAYEGLSSFGDDCLDELRIKGAANEIIGAEKAPQQFVSGQLRIAGNNQTHYGIVQGRIHKAVNDSQRLPVNILWTARELKVTDQDTRQPVYGPLLAGKAATLDIPAWFGNTIRLDIVKEKVAGKEQVVRKAFFFNHFDEATNILCLANVRIPPEMRTEMPDSVTLSPDLSTMVWFFDKVNELKDRARHQQLTAIQSKQAAASK